MRYILLNNGESFSAADEFYDPRSEKWSEIGMSGTVLRTHYPIRRLLVEDKKIETFTIPCGPWIGCTGTVFMDGKDKKVRLLNVFVGGDQLVIDFPRRQRYDEKHFILEDDEIIVEGDKFVSYFNDINNCQITLGMTVQAAKKKHTAIKLLVRPIS